MQVLEKWKKKKLFSGHQPVCGEDFFVDEFFVVKHKIFDGNARGASCNVIGDEARAAQNVRCACNAFYVVDFLDDKRFHQQFWVFFVVVFHLDGEIRLFVVPANAVAVFDVVFLDRHAFNLPARVICAVH